MHTTNPNYKPKSSITADLYPPLDGIEYPSFEDIKMKSKDTDTGKSIPRVNRANKPLPGQKSIDNTSAPISPITLAREKESMYDEALKKEQEVLTIGNQLKQFGSTPTIPNDESKWFDEQSALEYTFIQKEQELNDTISELRSVDQHEVENHMGTLQIDKQNPEMAEIAARLEAKRKALSQNKHRVKETKQEVEAKMNVIREKQKRHLQVSFTERSNSNI